MRTEISAKFRRDGVERELGGRRPRASRDWWTDPAGDFALSLSLPPERDARTAPRISTTAVVLLEWWRDRTHPTPPPCSPSRTSTWCRPTLPPADRSATRRGEILKGATLEVDAGTVHALMGPNGSGQVDARQRPARQPRLPGHGGQIRFRGEDITPLPTDERAARGLFLGFQHPEEIPGVQRAQLPAPGDRRAARASTTSRCSRCAWSSSSGRSASAWTTASQERYLNEGFSGGEKKRNEILQMAMMEPDLAVLDETDSGLDIDALRAGRRTASTRCASDRPELGILLITHYQRILDHLTPDVVHILLDGRIVATGGPELAAARRGARASTRSARRRAA